MNETVRHTSAPSSRRRKIFSAIAALSAVAGGIGVLLDEAGTTAAARTWHVSPSGNDRASGGAGDPLATIGQAVRVAESGDTIRIGPGVYHESVQVFREDLDLIGAGAAQTVLDGARPVVGFEREFDGRFGADWSTDFDRAAPPYTSADRPHGGWPEQFFLDGVQLTEVPSRDDVGPGTFFHSVSSGRVILGDDPTGRLVEGSVLNWGIYLNHADGSSLQGVTVQRYATQQREMAAIRAYADDVRISDVAVVDNARIGLSAMGDRIQIDRVDAIANGHLGIHGHLSSDLAVRSSRIHDNNREYFDAWHSAGGLKVTESQGLEIRGNDVRRNDGPGIWTDLDVRNAVIADNVVLDSMRSGIEIELSSDVITVDNVVARSGEQGVWVLESSRVDVFHNFLSDNERAVWVLDGPRADLVDVRIGNNVLAAPTSAGVLVAVDDWTEQRNAHGMRVSIDGNRYWAPSGTNLVRWSNWPAPLTIASDLGTVRSVGQEATGVVSAAASNPFADAATVLVSVPAHVTQARDGSVASTPPAPSAEAPRRGDRPIDDGGWIRGAVVDKDSTAIRRGDQRSGPARAQTSSLDLVGPSQPDPAPPIVEPATAVAVEVQVAPVDAAAADTTSSVTEPVERTDEPEVAVRVATGGWDGFAEHVAGLVRPGS